MKTKMKEMQKTIKAHEENYGRDLLYWNETDHVYIPVRLMKYAVRKYKPELEFGTPIIGIFRGKDVWLIPFRKGKLYAY